MGMKPIFPSTLRRYRPSGPKKSCGPISAGETSWYGYAHFVIEWARARGHPLELAPDALRPVSTRDYPTAAARPLNSRLDTRRLQQSFGLVLPPWQLGVERMLSEVLAP